MKKTTLLQVLLFTVITFQMNAQGIFDDTIHTAVEFGSVSSPGAEGVQNIIDQNSATKFLDFNAFDGIGFDVDLLGASHTAIAMEFVTANDAPERDPTAYEVFGSNDGITYTSVTTGTIPCVPTRFYSRTFSFTNALAYTFYRVNFTGTCGTSTINQIADVQLFEAIGNTPVITCSSDTNVNNTTGSCDAIVNYTAVTATDIEDGTLTPVLVSGLASGSTFPIGDTIVTYSVTDSDGNQQSCSFTVTVTDNENPSVTCPGNISMSVANSGDSSVAVTYTAPVAADNCGLANPITGFTPITNINNKVYYVSDAYLTPSEAYTDAGNQGGFVGTIRNDTDLATLSSALVTNGITEDLLIGYNDINVEGTFVWDSGDTATYSNWNAGEPNNAGNEDYTVMQFSTFWNDVNNLTSYRYILEVDYMPNQTAGFASGSQFPVGTTTNTFEVTDIAGNSVQCNFDVTITDALSLEEFSLQNSIILSPNPTIQTLTITNKSNIELDTISIYDVNGRRMNTINNMKGNTTINVANFSAGLYIIKITATSGETSIKRFIKH